MSPRQRVLVLALGLTLLTGAWIMSTAPFAAPDEQSHFVRAVGLSHGVFLGKHVPYPDPGLTPTQDKFISRNTRAVEVSQAMTPYDVGCVNGKPNPDHCLESSPNGNFQPLGYALPTLALGIFHHLPLALWMGRVGGAIQSLAFLLLAIALLWDRRSGLSLIGLCGATTPMVMYVFSILNPSGIEIGSSIAFAAAGIRISRDPGNVPRWVWVSAAASGAVTILSGPIGTVFGLADLAVALAALGVSGARTLWRGPRRAAATAIGVLAAAVIVSLIYTKVAGFSSTFGIHPFFTSLRLVRHQLWITMKDAVGDFGAEVIPLPLAACWAWWSFVIVLMAAATILGSWLERLALLAGTVLALAFPLLFWAFIDRYTGFGLLGREVMPPLLLIPIGAGEIIYRHRDRLDPGGLGVRLGAGAVFTFLAGFQAYGWLYNRKRSPHDESLIVNPHWSPPAGWALWTVVALAGCALVLVVAAGEALPADAIRAARARLTRRGQLQS